VVVPVDPGILPEGYPADLECVEETADGRRLHMRPIVPADGPRLVAFHSGLSPWSVYLRYFSAHPHLSRQDVERFTRVDYRDRLALVVEDGERLIAVGRYDRAGASGEAEVAFVVTDEYQHHGIGTLLLERLAGAARRNGVTAFVADTLAENRGMLDVFLRSGFQVSTSADHEVIHVRFPISSRAIDGEQASRWRAGRAGDLPRC